MNSYKKYLIISDLDGTLINSQHVISQNNLDAIEYFIKCGGTFAVATGRTIHNIRLHIKNLMLNGPCILYNGSALYDFEKEKFLNTEYLERYLLNEYIAYCMRTFKNMVVEIFTLEMMYIITPDENVDPYILLEKQVFERSTLDEVSKIKWIKVLLSDTPENLHKASRALADFGLVTQLNSVFSHKYYLELLKKDVSKGFGLKILKQLPEYRDKIVIAVGDYDNDIEMIKAADVGIAMDNARDCVKQVADKITVNNDQDALHDIIYNIIPSLSQA
ncbi:MAG TPA: Cof-type HAD-IIB family hydrolase [Ruminiclostridium sp.]